MNRIKEVALPDDLWTPGEFLCREFPYNDYNHVIISYDIEGDRYKIDKLISKYLEDDSNHLIKIGNVNTVLYWQSLFSGNDKESLLEDIRTKLIELLGEIFVNEDDLSRTNVDVFCMVGNIKAFSFKIKA
ncbi:TPA: hypothetical protein ACKR1W_002351 [Proteus mirabilis]|uniref:hypothetical protein n=1 Tax=Enterobacterales TaxID=91347 RepID=UPI0007CC6A64|nr:hypothetical protein [Proteus mirabilis]MBG2856402.1 hypothetical protein [Proteus mirabilis]MBI6367735.1 hypothetical protein [Proteus mirabilis]MBN7226191.1 hypothetical protein [Proteus mirabilis]MBN7246592.1 hypothetical protein [Proteus mirabilis]MBN7261440.1 hypothetical protein [Proteus mirabilis]